MKFRVTMITPLGTFYGRSQEGTEEEKERAVDMVATSGLSYLSLHDENDNTVVFRKGILEQSVIRIDKVD